MSRAMERLRARRAERTRGTYLVEALLMLACLLLVLAVVMSMLGFAWAQGARTDRMQQAMSLAQGTAERFAADPDQVPPLQEAGAFTITCEVEPEAQQAGTILNATVRVACDGEQLFELRTARYVSATEAAGSSAAESAEGGELR